MRHTSLLAVLPLLLAGCATSSVRNSSSAPTSWVVARGTTEAGDEVTWRMSSSVAGTPYLERTERRTYRIAYLGVRVDDLDRERAAALGLEPYTGVVLRTVEPDTAAARAGLEVGDVLLSLGPRPFTSRDQFSSAIREDFEPGEVVTAILQRPTGNSTQVLSPEVTLDARETSDVRADNTSLVTSELVRELTAMQVGEVPLDQAREALGLDAPAVFVTHVSPGGPAYRAGLRAGDRIVSVDGEPCTGLASVRDAVVVRARELGFAVDGSEEATTVAPTTREEPGPIEFEVTGPLGAHRCTVEPRDDLSAYRSFEIPILIDYGSTARYTEWSFLDFILQFGANYNSQYGDSTSRRPARSTFFSMLPFGFIEVEKRPGYARYCVLWFIEWRTNG